MAKVKCKPLSFTEVESKFAQMTGGLNIIKPLLFIKIEVTM